MPLHTWEQDNMLIMLDGKEVTIEPAMIPDESDCEYHPLLDLPVDFVITAFARNLRGMMDFLCGRTWTGSCRRFVRSNKRRKEKERRRKLKERTHED